MKKHPTPALSPLITLTIEKMVHGGAGLARCDGMACFVEGALPGETIRGRITELRSGFCTVELCGILESSAGRIQPACPLFGTCGGCQWRHIAYDRQLAFKSNIISDCLARIGKLPDIAPAPVAASPQAERYRSRAAFKLARGQADRIGFYRNRTHSVVDCRDCLLLEPELIQALRICRDLARREPERYSVFTDLQLLALEGKQVAAALWRNRAAALSMVLDLEAGAAREPCGPLQEEIDGVTFLRATDIFYQVNRLQNIAMIRKVQDLFSPVRGGAILDLFCGCGNFSLFLARGASRLTGIDSSTAAISQASENARLNGIANTRFLDCVIERIDPMLVGQDFSGVLVNPPRGGCALHTLELIAGRQPALIVYVSCNPATLARDLRSLVAKGYRIDTVQPYDMFPHTYHVETIVRLLRG